MSTTNRVAVVTGGAKGIGRAIAMSLACRGITVVIADIDQASSETTVKTITEMGGAAISIRVDMAKESDIASLIDTTVAQLGRLDILVNNAGILSSAPYDEVSEAEWDRVMGINVKSVFFATREALKPMIQQGWGRIVNISSLSGRSGGISAGPAYVASKSALIGMTRHFATKAARHGITVNAVAPGTTETDILKSYPEEQLVAQRKAILVGRFGKPEEIGETVAFLSSDAAAFITGAVLDVNGGMYMG